MPEPTKEKYQRVLDFISYALEHANEVALQHDAQILVERALRIAANLPSEEELAKSPILSDYVSQRFKRKVAALILERIKGEK